MKIDLLYLNDVHGYIEPHTDLFYRNNEEYTELVGGYSRIATLIKTVMEKNPNTLLFDGGDTFHGTSPVVQTKGQAIIPILNKLPFIAIVGHWDFGYGPQQLKHLLSQLHYPMLGINVYNEDGSLFLTPYILLQIEEIKIGVIGICSDIIDKTMPAHFSTGLKITSGLEELPTFISQLKNEGADLIFLLSHNGFPQDMYMLKKVEGIDVCLSAHTHNRLYQGVKVNNTILVQCGCHGSFLGHLELNIDNKSIKSHEYALIKVEQSITPDDEIDNLVKLATHPYNHLKENIVGSTDIVLHRYNTLNSSMDDLLLSSIKYLSKTEIAFSNGWRYGAPIAAGKITEWDLFNIIPMNPPISTVELTGREIIEMLEQNLERTFSSEPMKQMGGYVKRCSGLRINIRIENPEGHRIQEIYFGDNHLEMDLTYKVSFVTSQGVPKNYGKNRMEIGVKAVDAMIAFLKDHSPYNPTGKDSFYLV